MFLVRLSEVKRMSGNRVEFAIPEFKEFIDREKGRWKQGTWKNRQSGMVKFEGWLSEYNKDYRDITPRDIDSWLSWMTRDKEEGGEGLADLTAWEYLTAVRIFYDWYYMNESDAVNPAREVGTRHLNRNPEHDKPTLDEQELRALVNSAESVRGRALLALMASTGMRVGEAVSLKRTQIELKTRTVHDVETEKRRDGHTRPVWFDRTTRRYLRKWLKGGYREQYATDSDYFFTSYGERGEHMSTDRAREEFVDAVKNCSEIEYLVNFTELSDGRERCSVTTHILRRSCFQIMADNGATGLQLQALAGWKKIETANEYITGNTNRDVRDKTGPSL